MEQKEPELFPDAFTEARQSTGVEKIDDQNDPVLMVLGHKQVRKCAHNWQTFQSGATPGRIVVPSEVKIRDTRQIPFELDPPEHGIYRALLEKWFRRPLLAEYQTALRELVAESIQSALDEEQVEVVHQFALPLQSRALTLLFKVPMAEAEHWISWGTHVFRSDGDPLDSSKANLLYDYIDQQIDKAAQQPGDDLYSLLLAARVNDQPLTREEIKGVLILTFAGGRDTIINALTNTLAYLAAHPEALAQIRENPGMVAKATEELMRYFSPLTHMGRVATENTTVCAHAVPEDSRISLCWAAANRDETVFERPNEVVLDRKLNPHVAFGFGHHKCLGASHARQLIRTLLLCLAEQVETIQVKDYQENREQWGEFRRKVGYHSFVASFQARS